MKLSFRSLSFHWEKTAIFLPNVLEKFLIVGIEFLIERQNHR